MNRYRVVIARTLTYEVVNVQAADGHGARQIALAMLPTLSAVKEETITTRQFYSGSDNAADEWPENYGEPAGSSPSERAAILRMKR